MPEIAVTLFGTTLGLELCTFPRERQVPADVWVEASPTEVTLSAEREVCIARRGVVENEVATWIGLYKKAYEIDGSREGGFFGCGLWLFGGRADGAAVLALLRYLVQEVERVAIDRGRFKRRLGDIRNEVRLASVRETLVAAIYSSLEPNLPISLAVPINQSTILVDLGEPAIGSVSAEWMLDWAQAGCGLFGLYTRVVLGMYPGAFSTQGSQRGSHVLTPRDLLREEAKRYLGVLEGWDVTKNELRMESSALEICRGERQAFEEQMIRSRIAMYEDLRSFIAGADEKIKTANGLLQSIKERLPREVVSRPGSTPVGGHGGRYAPFPPDEFDENRGRSRPGSSLPRPTPPDDVRLPPSGSRRDSSPIRGPQHSLPEPDRWSEPGLPHKRADSRSDGRLASFRDWFAEFDGATLLWLAGGVSLLIVVFVFAVVVYWGHSSRWF